MRRRIPEIPQSVEELKHRLKTEEDVRKRPRVQLLYLLRSGQATTRQQAASLLGVHRHSVEAWLRAYEQGGIEAMCTIQKAPGKRPRMTPSGLEALKERLANPKGFSSFKQIQQYLEQEQGVVLSYARVHALVRYGLQAKPKTPRPSAKKKIRRR